MSTLLAILYTAATLILHGVLLCAVVLGLGVGAYFVHKARAGAQPTAGAVIVLVLLAVSYAAAFIGAALTLE